MKVVTFTSRHKDNQEVKDFRPRTRVFVTNKEVTELEQAFDEFVDKGKDGELARFYYTVNDRNQELTRQDLVCELVKNPSLDLSKLDGKLASLAAKPKNALTKKWLFDFDSNDKNLLHSFLEEVGEQTEVEMVHKTVNNYAVVVTHGFDTRELLKKYEFVELKRDANLCYKWKRKGK